MFLFVTGWNMSKRPRDQDDLINLLWDEPVEVLRFYLNDGKLSLDSYTELLRARNVGRQYPYAPGKGKSKGFGAGRRPGKGSYGRGKGFEFLEQDDEEMFDAPLEEGFEEFDQGPAERSTAPEYYAQHPGKGSYGRGKGFEVLEQDDEEMFDAPLEEGF